MHSGRAAHIRDERLQESMGVHGQPVGEVLRIAPGRLVVGCCGVWQLGSSGGPKGEHAGPTSSASLRSNSTVSRLRSLTSCCRQTPRRIRTRIHGRERGQKTPIYLCQGRGAPWASQCARFVPYTCHPPHSAGSPPPRLQKCTSRRAASDWQRAVTSPERPPESIHTYCGRRAG